MHRSAPLVFAALLVLLAPASTRAQDEEQKKPTPQEASLAVVKSYLEKIKAKDAKSGLEEFWSFDAMCRGIFKKNFTKMSKKDQAETAKTLHEMLLPTMTSPQVADAMANASYEGFETGKPKKGRVQVSFTITLALEGAKPTKQFMWVKKVAGEYKVVDIANGAAEQALSKTIGAQYGQHAETLTPLDYIRLMKQG